MHSSQYVFHSIPILINMFSNQYPFHSACTPVNTHSCQHAFHSTYIPIKCIFQNPFGSQTAITYNTHLSLFNPFFSIPPPLPPSIFHFKSRRFNGKKEEDVSETSTAHWRSITAPTNMDNIHYWRFHEETLAGAASRNETLTSTMHEEAHRRETVIMETKEQSVYNIYIYM